MKKLLLLVFACITFDTFCQNVAWYPLKNENSTIWGENLDIKDFLSEYPRPTMVRDNWMSLNGIWNFTIADNDSTRPKNFDRQILVPFPVESTLSGINETVTPSKKLWYKRNFIIPEDWSYRYILLHIGASDWETKVYINGEYAGIHRGGYDPFSLDITFLLKEKGRQEITIEVWDPTDEHYQPRGKQKINPSNEWHTPVSGIWQTVWIEPVMWASIKDLKVTPDVDNSKVKIDVSTFQAYAEDTIVCTILENKKVVDQKRKAVNSIFEFTLENPKLWSPKSPHLYQLGFSLIRNGQKIDSVSSYFGMRKISVEENNGKKWVYLNNKPLYLNGIVDQGYWPDGLYTAPSDKALVYDISKAKELGFNAIRKFVKVEPERWYYHCDQLGMIVWQDMPCGDMSEGAEKESERSFASESQFKIELEAVLRANFNHPSIITWTPFTNGWGQFKTIEITQWMQTIDTTRLISGPAGGEDFPVGDIMVSHHMNEPVLPDGHADGRALAIGAYGGIYYPTKLVPVSEYLASKYQFVDSSNELTQAYLGLNEQSLPLIVGGISGAFYYQLTDIENEANGLMTFDRKEIKVNSKKIKKGHQSIFQQYENVIK